MGTRYPMGMGMGVNLCPWVLKWVGIESFCGYGFGQKEVIPAHTLPIAIKQSTYTCKSKSIAVECKTFAYEGKGRSLEGANAM